MAKFSKMFLAQQVEVQGTVVEGMEGVSGRCRGINARKRPNQKKILKKRKTKFLQYVQKDKFFSKKTFLKHTKIPEQK